MDPRQRWEALQAELAAARTAIDAGDPSKGLEHVDAALAIDPNFVAAQWLRDHVLTSAAPPPLAADQPGAASALFQESDEPALLAKGYSEFEERARRRLFNRRIDAARVAMQQRRLEDARAAISELRALDPGLPELSELSARFDELRRGVSGARRGRWVAAAVFVVILFGSSSNNSKPPAITTSSAIASSATAGELGRPVETAVPTPTERPISRPEPIIVVSQVSEPSRTPAFRQPIGDLGVVPGAPGPVIAPATSLPVTTPQQPLVPPRTLEEPSVAPMAALSTPGAPAPSNPAVPPVSPVPGVNDERLIQDTLRRYRIAYEGLDAQSAHAVYPGLNEAALARAFDGLQSQSLTFDVCDIQLLGGSATATCRGTARYVAKIGRQEPRTEPRLWSFTLRKDADDWTIEKALAYLPRE